MFLLKGSYKKYYKFPWVKYVTYIGHKGNKGQAEYVTNIGHQERSLNWKQCVWKELLQDKDRGLIKVQTVLLYLLNRLLHACDWLHLSRTRLSRTSLCLKPNPVSHGLGSLFLSLDIACIESSRLSGPNTVLLELFVFSIGTKLSVYLERVLKLLV